MLTLPAATQEIADEAFYGNKSLTEIKLPEGVKAIGERAFADSGLKYINLPESVTYIGDDVFEGAPLSLVRVASGSHAQFYCDEWEIPYTTGAYAVMESPHPYAPNTDQTWTWTGDADTVWIEVFFSQDTEMTVWGDDFLYVMDAKGNEIGSYLYDDLAGARFCIEGNRFSVRLTSDDWLARYGFAVSQVVQHKTTDIQLLAQENVTPAVGQPMAVNLQVYGVANPTCAMRVLRDGVVLDARTTQDAKYTYTPTQTGRYTLEAKLLNGSGAVVRETSIETDVTEKAFKFYMRLSGGCTITGCADTDRTGELHLPEVVYGETVTTIGAVAFSKCSGFTGDLVLPAGVTEIRESAFRNCSGFTGNLVLPESLIEIGNYAFSGCSGFTGDLVLPEGLTRIYKSAFEGCSGFTGNLVLPEGLTRIYGSAFKGCSGFTGNLVLPASLTIMQGRVFEGCSGFTGNLVLPAGLTRIYGSAFKGCSGFTGKLELPAGLTEIGGDAFYGCKGFTGDLVLPAGMTKIEENAFYGCSGFNGDLVLPASIQEIGYNAFKNTKNITDVTLLEGVERIQTTAFAQSGLKRISLPESLTYIAPDAFEGVSLERALVKKGSYAARYCEAKGFPCAYAPFLASAHPYANHANQTWRWKGRAETTWLEVTFSQETALENGYDYLYVMDANGAEIGRYTGTELSGKTLRIEGNGFSLRLTSNDSETRYGFSITEIMQHWKVYNVDWFAAKDAGMLATIGLARNKQATLTDLRTVKSLRVHVQSTGNDADVEPLTAADTSTLCSIYGVSWPTQISYVRRPALLTTSTGHQIVCSIYGQPIGAQDITDNGFVGQFCLHFTNSRTHNSNVVDEGHQNAIAEAIQIVKGKGEQVETLP